MTLTWIASSQRVMYGVPRLCRNTAPLVTRRQARASKDVQRRLGVRNRRDSGHVVRGLYLWPSGTGDYSMADRDAICPSCEQIGIQNVPQRRLSIRELNLTL